MGFKRRAALILLLIVSSAFTLPLQTKTEPSSAARQQLGVLIPMRDGVRLDADVFLPSAGSRWPAVLVRTPYSRKTASAQAYRFFARRGYAVVLEDVRGRYASQGVFGTIQQEGPDGNDTINWISEQPWSNGRVAMVGGSYLGIVQWWAAVQDNPHLFAISPMTSGDDDYEDRFYSSGGALQLGHRLLWIAENFTPPTKQKLPFSSYASHLPLRTADVSATGFTIPLWQSALDHPSYDDFWQRLSIQKQIKRVGVPVLSLGGWFDEYARNDLDAFSRLSRSNKQVETWIGPWAHNPAWKFSTLNFGPQASVHIRSLQADWLDSLSGKTDTREQAEALRSTLHIFVMGPNIWRDEHEWPLARTRYTSLYLNSKGHANTVKGDGALRWQIRNSQPDTFTYDPKNPVPTLGGATCCDLNVLAPGPLDQSPVETRPDVLIYTSEPLSDDLEVTGSVRAIVYASTSANDTDFTAKLVDVQPNGRPLLVTDGLQRLRYRLSLDHPVFVKRNSVYQITIDAGVTSYVFQPGHRIRLEVSSSNFPRFDRNLNTAAPNADGTKFNKAHQTIFHDKSYPSALILPVIPSNSGPPTPGQLQSRQQISELHRGPSPR